MTASCSVLTIARSDLEEIRMLALGAYPEECCGWLIGMQRAEAVQVTGIEATRNEAREPGERFTISPAATLAASRRAARLGGELVGTFHSHPDRDARPSALDLETLWRGASHLIAAVAGDRVGSMRSWRIADGVAVEETMVVTAAIRR